MANHVLVDNITHRDLKVKLERSTAMGDSVSCTVIFPIEFRQIQSEYLIVFAKNSDTGRFEPMALFGLSENENLYLGNGGWNASYIPLTIERQPFLIGFQNATVDGVDTQQPVVYVDADSPRISQSEGEPVFLEHGGSSPYLEHINSVLLSVHEGHAENETFSAALADAGLLEPFSLAVELNNHSKQKVSGFYTINEEALRELSSETLAALHSSGYLQHIYMVVASTVNFRTLISRKNALL
jgi:hypothetical protein